MVLLEKPLCLQIGQKRLKLYQPTLGKLLLIRPMLEEVVEGDEEITNILVHTLLKVAAKRETICEIIAIHSFKDSKDILDPYRIEERAQEFAQLEDSDIALLFLETLSFPKADKIIEASGIKKELERRERISNAKNTDGCALLGATTLYGGIIGHAMERYGWSLQYVLWGITAANLQLLAVDESASVYLSEDERKNVLPSDMSTKTIDATDPKNASLVRDLLTGKHKQ